MAYLSKIPRGLTLPQERVVKRQLREAHELDHKARVRKRDKHRCRWPHKCTSKKLEVAHRKSKGIGGDHGNRTTADQMLLVCWEIHQGPYPARSMHTGDLTVYPLTEQGTDGPCAFYDGLTLVATETAPGVLEKC